MFVRSVIIDTATLHQHLAFHSVKSGWVSAAGGKLMGWKGFFKMMFGWRWDRLVFSEFPVESLIFFSGVVVVLILTKQC